jgi:peptidoglycan/xylan/chitin deacetylase (PgdA/CDA1 family)
LPSLTDTDLQWEIRRSKELLEDLLGVEINAFAYPYGGENARVRSAVARAGYKWAFSSQSGLSFWDDPMQIKRVSVHDSDSIVALLSKALTGNSIAQHTFETAARLRDGINRNRIPST